MSRVRNNPFLTALVARALLSYDPDTGVFTWRPRFPKSEFDRRTEHWNEVRAGRQAGHVDDDGVRRIVIFSRPYLASRIAWLIHKGRWPKRKLRFRDGNPSNVCIDNLKMPKPSELRGRKRQ